MDDVWQVVLTWFRTLNAGLNSVVWSTAWWWRVGFSAAFGFLAGYYIAHCVTNFLANWGSWLPLCRRCGHPYPPRGRAWPFRVGVWSRRWTCAACGQTSSLNPWPTMLLSIAVLRPPSVTVGAPALSSMSPAAVITWPGTKPLSRSVPMLRPRLPARVRRAR